MLHGLELSSEEDKGARRHTIAVFLYKDVVEFGQRACDQHTLASFSVCYRHNSRRRDELSFPLGILYASDHRGPF